jgi:hypothetical protein
MHSQATTPPVRMPYMGTKKNKSKAGKAGKYKPHRVVRIPESVALLLEELAIEDLNNLAIQVRNACRDRLIARGKLPRPSGPAD